MGVTSCATLPFLPGTHVFSTAFKLLQANSTLFKHLWLVTVRGFRWNLVQGDRVIAMRRTLMSAWIETVFMIWYNR